MKHDDDAPTFAHRMLAALEPLLDVPVNDVVWNEREILRLSGLTVETLRSEYSFWSRHGIVVPARRYEAELRRRGLEP